MTLTWEKYVPYFAAKASTRVVSIQWRLDGSKIAAALDSDAGQSITILLLNSLSGSLFYGASAASHTGGSYTS